MSLLINVIKRGDKKNFVKKILDERADPNFRDSKGNTPLYYAFNSDNGLEITELLLEYKADPNLNIDSKNTILSWVYDTPNFAEVLLKYRADPNNSGNSNFPLLTLAVETSDLDTIRMLVEAKADINLKNKYGQTALDVAKDVGVDDIVDYLISQHRNQITDELTQQVISPQGEITTLFPFPIPGGHIRVFQHLSELLFSRQDIDEQDPDDYNPPSPS